jgi:phosphoribosylanthranilate isomerase
MVRVKICGIKSIDEAWMAVDAGADAFGLIVGATHKTEDVLKPETAHYILKEAPPYISSVLVTHLTTAKEILAIYTKVPACHIQLQDNISIDEIDKLRKNLKHVKLIKAIHVVRKDAVDAAKYFAPNVDALLLDSKTRFRIGGTGKVHDWNISRDIVESIEIPIILAGGLTPENVVEAIKKVRPFGVDVNTGVKFPDGTKNPQLIKDFVSRARFG